MVRSIRQLRRSGVWLISVTLLAGAAAAYFAAHKMEDWAHSKFLAKRQVADLKSVASDMQAVIEGASIGEGFDNLSHTNADMHVSYARLKSNLSTEQLSWLASAFEPFADFMGQEADFIRRGEIEKARDMDELRLDPAYTKLLKVLSQIDLQLEQEAKTLHHEADLLLGAVLFGGALFSIVLIWQHQNRLVRLAAEHMEEKTLAASERRFLSIAAHSADVITLLDKDWNVAYATGSAEPIFEKRANELVGSPILEFCHPDDAARLFNTLHEISERPNMQASTEVRVVSPEGAIRHAEVFAINLQQNQDVAGTLVTFHNLTERKQFEEQLAHQAFHDKLTGLPNRALFLDRLSHSLQMANRSGSQVTIMFLDMDNFKVINDSLGHEAGDMLLIQFAERLKAVFRVSDTIGRLGGDEFVVLLSSPISVSDAIFMAKRVQHSCESSFLVAGREIFVTPSIGLATNSDLSDDADSLLRDADTAMYQAKANGKASYMVFDRSMNDLAVERLEMESELRTALKNHEFALHYQPVFSMDTTEIVGVEALLRWQHPTRGVVPPTKFIPIAEETGLIIEMGEWVMREACLQLKAWTSEFPAYENLKVGINVSGRQLSQPGFARKVKSILSQCNVQPRQVVLEITETFMVHDLDLSARVLQELRDLGLGIAIDDFGTGYSSMSYLSKLPVDTLKIDRSFIETMQADETGEGLVQAMIAMARTLGLNVVSEGIETPAQLSQLQQLGSDLAQGFLLAKPLSVGSLTHLLATNQGKVKLKQVA